MLGVSGKNLQNFMLIGAVVVKNELKLFLVSGDEKWGDKSQYQSLCKQQ